MSKSNRTTDPEAAARALGAQNAAIVLSQTVPLGVACASFAMTESKQAVLLFHDGPQIPSQVVPFAQYYGLLVEMCKLPRT